MLLILLAGSCSGVFSVPFKFNRDWAWENNWFIWSFAALLVMPWLMAWLTVPRLGTLYGADPHSTSLVAPLATPCRAARLARSCSRK